MDGTSGPAFHNTGSRSCDTEYLEATERLLTERPWLVYYRALFGPPLHQVLKSHLIRLLELAHLDVEDLRRRGQVQFPPARPTGGSGDPGEAAIAASRTRHAPQR
jgi:hypothetical protein